MRSKFVLLILISFCSHIVFGQFEEEVTFEKLIRGKLAYIIKDEVEINIYGIENLAKEFRIRRKYSIKILTTDAAVKFSTYTLPESFDPTLIMHGPKVKNLGTYYSDFKIADFSARIERNKKSFQPKVKKRRKEVESFNIDYLYDYDLEEYFVQDVRVGDVITISYDIDIPFFGNYSRFASNRIFFHDSIPKLDYKLTISRHETLDIDLYQFNKAKTKRITSRDKIQYYIYEYQNLPGCINEEGSRPYKELPYLTWVVNMLQYYIPSSVYPINVPQYAIVADMRAPNLTEILNSVHIGSRSKQFYPFTTMYDSVVKESTDKLLMREIHRRINEEFQYKPDVEYYRHNDNRGERIGEYFQNKILRDHSRYNLYYALMVKSETQFFSSFIIDKRVGEIRDEYFQPTFDNDFLLTSYYGERLLDFLHPKSSRYGWYYNELPFYWEDCKVRLVHISDYAKYRYPINESFRSGTTGKSDDRNNLRKIECKAVIDLDFDSAYIESEIHMSGQFSTIGRGAYNLGPKDPTVNPEYTKPIYRFHKINHPKSLEGKVIMKNPPFYTESNCSYVVPETVVENDGEMALDLTDWFPHIVPDINFSESRFLNYHPDFLGVDEINYELQFSRPIELLQELKNIEVSNMFGVYSFKVSQKNSNVIEISSILQIHGENINTTDFDQVAAIYAAVKKTRKLKIRFR